MVDMRVKKKIPYYIFSVAALYVMALLGPLRQIGNREGFISVLDAIVHLPRATLLESTVEEAFRVCGTQWMYTLMPVAASIASASFIYEELKSKFYMGAEFRRGRYRYVYSRFLYSAASGAATVAVGFMVYGVLVYCIFPINAVDDETMISLWESVLHSLGSILYPAMYGMAMSVLATFLVYLYPNLYVDLSFLFIVAYVLRETAMNENILFPFFLIVGMAILYGVMWNVRGERI